MIRLIIDNKTGFNVKNVNKPIIIRDKRGILFYSTESLLPRVTYFNLPPGEYFIDSGDFVKALLPRKYPLVTLPKRQRYFYPNPERFKVVFGNTPHKCKVNWDNETITFDSSFKEKPLPEIDFILFHEHGHQFFSTEKYCDMYARNKMLKIGYNPSQVGYAQIDSLSDMQDERKKFIIDSFAKKYE